MSKELTSVYTWIVEEEEEERRTRRIWRRRKLGKTIGREGRETVESISPANSQPLPDKKVFLSPRNSSSAFHQCFSLPHSASASSYFLRLLLQFARTSSLLLFTVLLASEAGQSSGLGLGLVKVSLQISGSFFRHQRCWKNLKLRMGRF